MEKMRQTSPYLLALFAIIFVGFMVASDVDVSNLMMQGDNYQTAPIGEVNGEKILYREFEDRVREMQEQQIEQMRAQGMEQEIDYSILRGQVWKEMVEEVLIKQQVAKMGVMVTDEEMLDIMLNNPPEYLRKPFTDSLGNFQRESYIEIMTKPDVIYQRLPQEMSQEEKRNIVETFRRDIFKIEKAMREEKVRNNLNNAVNTSLSFASPLFIKEKFYADNSIADVDFIFLDARFVNDNEINITDEEMLTYYNKYKKLWPVKERRKLKYVTFPILPSENDTNQFLKNIQRMQNELASATNAEDAEKVFAKKMDEHRGEIFDFTAVKDIPSNILTYLSGLTVGQFVGPIEMPDGTYFIKMEDRRSGENVVVKASHILIEFGENKDSSKARANEIKTQAMKGNFEQLAIENSADPGSARNGGDLGYFGKGQMVPEFETAAFGASVGSVVGPIETQFGWHIIKVTDKQSDEIKYSTIKFQATVSRMTSKAISRDAKEFALKLEAGEKFDDIAPAFNKVPRESESITSDKPILGSNFVTAKAFNIKLSEVVGPVELKIVGIFVAQLVEIKETGFIDFEDMKATIKSILTQNKKVAALKSKADGVYNRVKNLSNLSEFVSDDQSVAFQSVAGVKNNGVVPGLSQDYPFTVAAFKLPVNKISEPVRGEKGYYILQVKQRNIPSEAEKKAQIDEYTTQLRNNFKSAGYYQWFNKLREDSKIKDLRINFMNEF